MTVTDYDLQKLVLDTGALKIWNRETGPVSWGAAKVPLPFYINTEMMLGRQLSDRLLAGITAICASSPHAEPRAIELNKLIMDAYNETPVWQNLIETMAEKEVSRFSHLHYEFVSGGERRDWLFSIPFAHRMRKSHLFLFKNGTSWCKEPLIAGGRALHVCDLINNAASHFDRWFPMLKELSYGCAATLAVNSRGTNGMRRLTDRGVFALALNEIAMPFFEQIEKNGLIDKETLEEIGVFFFSPEAWAAKYLMNRAEVFGVAGMDAKSHERALGFFTQDPWQLRPSHEKFFGEMLTALGKRQAA